MFTMKQQPQFGAVGWIATCIYHLFLSVNARSDPPYAVTFFICYRTMLHWSEAKPRQEVVKAFVVERHFPRGIRRAVNICTK